MRPLLDTLQLAILTGETGVYRHASWRRSGDNSPFTRLYCVVGGSGFVRHHGREFRLQPGHAYLIPPYSNLDLGTPSEVAIWWVHLDAKLSGGADLFTVLPPPIHEIGGADGRRAADWMGRVVELRRRGDAARGLAARGLLLQILGLFYRGGAAAPAAAAEQQAEWRRFQPVLARIEERLGGELRVGELAALAGLGRAAFSLRFKVLCGMSPARYIHRRRLECAQMLLRKPELKLAAVAAATGFHDAFHLSKAFKRLTGRSPREFRKLPPPPLP
ncbi:MAG: AraC family transcriptional regulator [Lentisphaeria bacterium]|jgi:AraC-like DNA-binding protein